MARMSERRSQRRHYLKNVKKQIGKNIDGEIFTKEAFEEMKSGFREQGKQMRIEDLRESLEIEKEKLMHQEEELRNKLKSDGLSKKDVEKAIEAWYDNQKIWSIHSDTTNQLT